MTDTEEIITESNYIAEAHGERYRGWYHTQTLLRVDQVDLFYPDNNRESGFRPIPFKYSVYDYNYRFLMPPSVETLTGTIRYTTAERLFSVFRFPIDEKGDFCSPTPPQEIEKAFKSMTTEEVQAFIKKRQVLTFEAFRIPQYGFEYMALLEDDFKGLTLSTDENFSNNFKTKYEADLQRKIETVKEKISSTANTLLILEKVLQKDPNWKDFNEVSLATNNIIHI